MAKLTYIKLFVDYLDAIEPLGDAERGRLFTSLLEYAKTGVAPQLNGNERFLFPMMRAGLDRDMAEMDDISKARSEAGKKSAEAKANKSKQNKQLPTKASKSNKEKDKDDIIPPTPLKPKTLDSLLPEYAFADGLSAKIGDWVQYKQERKEGYKEQGLKSLLTQIQKNALKYGDNAVIDLIDLSMSNGWKGIIWDKLTEPQWPTYSRKPEIPKGCGELGDAELEAIQRVLRGD